MVNTNAYRSSPVIHKWMSHLVGYVHIPMKLLTTSSAQIFVAIPTFKRMKSSIATPARPTYDGHML